MAFIIAVLLLQALPVQVEAKLLYTKQSRTQEGTEVLVSASGGIHASEEPNHELDSSSAFDGAASKEYRVKVRGSTPIGLVKVGTPPVTMPVILDTGSNKLLAKTWFTLLKELRSLDETAAGAVSSTGLLYDHKLSRTFKPLFSTLNDSSGVTHPKRSLIVYGSGKAFSQDGVDTVKLENYQINDFPVSEIGSDSIRILHGKANVSGILGLQHVKNHSLGESMFSRLRSANLMTSFGYCRGGNDSGSFIWGDRSDEGEPVEVLGQMHWAVRLTDVAARNQQEPTPSSVPNMAVLQTRTNTSAATLDQEAQPECKDGCVAVIDSGSNIIGLPRHILRKLARQIRLRADCSNVYSRPPLTLMLGNVSITIPPEAYTMRVRIKRAAASKASQSRKHASKKATSFRSSTDAVLAEDEDLSSTTSSLDAKLAFDHFLQDAQTRGLELEPSLAEDAMDGFHQRLSMCMLAFMALDRSTDFGPLWVMGTPLFEKYYARWSFKQDDASPKVYLKDKASSDTCASEHLESEEFNAAQRQQQEKDLRALQDESLKVLEKDLGQKLESLKNLEDELKLQTTESAPTFVQLRELDVDDIRYPHWASELTQL